jgi:Fur family ferric uptake transcriptional regulator
MKDATTLKIVFLLKERGYRVTQARIGVIGALSNGHVPQSIQSLCETVKVDATSVYRTIAMLKKEGLIEEIITQGGIARYAISHGHHHHVVCTSCEKVVHIDCGKEPKAPRHIDGFATIVSHELTFYGLCSSCIN